MKKIFAKLKNGQHVIVFNDADTDTLKDLYKTPNVTAAIPFEIESRKMTEGEWYFIVLTEEQKEEMLGEYASESGSMVLNEISADDYPEMKAIYLVSGEEKLFAKINSRHLQKSKKYLTFGDKPQVVEQGNSVLLSGEVDAYWTGTRLYFKKFTVARSLFKGIQKVYKEATEKETNEFLSGALFELKEEMSSEFIGLQNRKKIASIIARKTIDLQDPNTCGKYLQYAKQYDLDLEIDNGKIALIDNSDVNKVIGLLGENFYTTEITGEKREIRTSKKLVHLKRKRAK
jgi:hypothetical protein